MGSKITLCHKCKKENKAVSPAWLFAFCSQEPFDRRSATGCRSCDGQEVASLLSAPALPLPSARVTQWGDRHSPWKTGKSGIPVGMPKSQIAEHGGVLNQSIRNTEIAVCLKPCLRCFPRETGIQSLESPVCSVLSAPFCSQGLGNAPRRREINPRPASPLPRFEPMALH